MPAYTESTPERVGRAEPRERGRAGTAAAPDGSIRPHPPAHRRTASASSTACRVAPSRSTRCTSCSKNRRTASPTGAPPRTKSTTGASSTSTRSPACESRTRRCSRRFTCCSRACSREGRVTGVRIDHPDGLFDPSAYFSMLQDVAADAWGEPRAAGERPLVCRGREDPLRPRAAAPRLGGAWNDRLQLPQPAEQRLPRERKRPRDAPHLRTPDRPRPRASTICCTTRSGSSWTRRWRAS